jgi:cell division septum initiation protein DivIVA
MSSPLSEQVAEDINRLIDNNSYLNDRNHRLRDMIAERDLIIAELRQQNTSGEATVVNMSQADVADMMRTLMEVKEEIVKLSTRMDAMNNLSSIPDRVVMLETRAAMQEKQAVVNRWTLGTIFAAIAALAAIAVSHLQWH